MTDLVGERAAAINKLAVQDQSPMNTTYTKQPNTGKRPLAPLATNSHGSGTNQQKTTAGATDSHHHDHHRHHLQQPSTSAAGEQQLEQIANSQMRQRNVPGSKEAQMKRSVSVESNSHPMANMKHSNSLSGRQFETLIGVAKAANSITPSSSNQHNNNKGDSKRYFLHQQQIPIT